MPHELLVVLALQEGHARADVEGAESARLPCLLEGLGFLEVGLPLDAGQ